MFIAIILSIIAGMTIVLTRIINFKLSDQIGLYQSTFFNYITGLIGSLVLLAFNPFFPVTTYNFAPTDYLMFFGGLLGVIVVTLSSYITPKISVFYATLFMFIGQITIALLFDSLFLGQFSFSKFVGSLLVFTGLSYNLFLDTKKVA